MRFLFRRSDAPAPWWQSRWGTRRRFTWRRLIAWLTPARLFVLSFGTLISLGTLAFHFIPALYTSGVALGWIDALFMATSAVCVTGLSVISVANDFTFAGQLVLLMLVQLGGLGLLTLASGILLTVGRRMMLSHEELVRASGDVLPEVDYRQLVRQVLRFTFTIEAAGFVLLYMAWAGRFGLLGAVWPSAFHSITAFANAGFSIFEQGIVLFQRDQLSLMILLLLIVLGGIGFLTLSELARRIDPEHARVRRLSLHARVVFAATLVILVLGSFQFGLAEWNNTLAGMSTADKIFNAAFASGSARTAGFNAVDFHDVRSPTAFFTIILMFIGGAPASLAGGIKVTTIALLMLLAWTRLRGRRNVSIYHRSIPDETLGRAIGLAVIAMIAVSAAIFLMVAIDPRAAAYQDFLPYMFEVVSAFGTAGLSMGVTSELSDPARVLVTVLMFTGRVGVLTLAAALSLDRRALPFRYAKEDVAIG